MYRHALSAVIERDKATGELVALVLVRHVGVHCNGFCSRFYDRIVGE